MKQWLTANRGFLIFLVCLGFFRTAVADWNPIPSSSMRPTLLEGDVVLVNRLAYDLKIPLTDISVLQLGTPRRGDVITFRSPKDGIRLIKRLIAVPGDTLEMRDNQLFLNGIYVPHYAAVVEQESLASESTSAIQAIEELAGRKHEVQFLPAVLALRDFEPLIVPPGKYFFLGDNRDNSADSRYIGFVPRSLLIGRAHHILVSADIMGNWRPRLQRIGSGIQ